MFAIVDKIVPLALGLVMLGLGLSLTVDDFRRVARSPRAVAVALACQVIVLPAVCAALAHVFALPPELAVGLMLLAASPGGITANVFSHLARGDVALNITLTAINSASSLFTMPLVVGWSLAHFMGDAHAVPVQLQKLVQVLLVIIVPVSVGMVLRRRKPSWSAWLDRPVRVLGGILLVVIIASSLGQESAQLGATSLRVALAALAFNVASLSVGTLLARALRLPARQAVSIGFEVGVHNAGLAILLARAVLERPVMAFPPAMYGWIVLVTGALYAGVASRILAATPRATD